MSTISKTGGSSKNDNNTKILDSKIAMIAKYLDTKVNKSGSVMTGDLDLGKNRITYVKDPEDDGDAVNKGYCLDLVSHACNQLKTDIIAQVEVNMIHWINSKLDMGSLDAINKKYLQIAALENIGTSGSTTSTEKLMITCRFVNDLLLKHCKDFISVYDVKFKSKYTWMQNIILKNSKLGLYKKPFHQAIESILVTYRTDILYLLISVVEDLPQNIFMELKEFLVRDKILNTPEDGTDLIKIRRFIQKFANDLDPNRENENLELLLQKNLMFVDLGFAYVSNTLLKQFVL